MRAGLVVTTSLGICLTQLAMGARGWAAPAAPDRLAPALDPGRRPLFPPAAALPPVAALPMAAYQSAKKRHGVALLCEFLLPGLGSLYADHPTGAVITWGVLATGLGLFVYGATGLRSGGHGFAFEGANEPRPRYGMMGGLLIMTGGMVHGLTDAWRSTSRYNDRLRGQLGLPAHVSFESPLRLTF